MLHCMSHLEVLGLGGVTTFLIHICFPFPNFIKLSNIIHNKYVINKYVLLNKCVKKKKHTYQWVKGTQIYTGVKGTETYGYQADKGNTRIIRHPGGKYKLVGITLILKSIIN